jgi:hypothetical protein
VSARLGEVNLDSDCDQMVDTEYINTIDSIFGILRNSSDDMQSSDNSSCASTPQNIEIEEVVVHPGYQYSFIDGFPNDVALVRLKEKAKVDSFVQPICLRGFYYKLTAAEEEKGALTVSGWGMTNMHGKDKNKII